MSETEAATGPDIQFQQFLAEGRFMIQRGINSGKYVFFPRTFAPGTGEALEWVEASGRGTVYSTTAIHKRPPEPAVSVVLIDLEEGPRMMSGVEGMDATKVPIGLAVTARIVAADDGFKVVFEPAPEVGA